MGGLVSTASKRPSIAAKPSDCSTRHARPLSAALAEVSAAARSFMSAQVSSMPGLRAFTNRPSGPQPQPRSSTLPASGGSARIISSVPASSSPRENTPASVSNRSLSPSTSIARRFTSWRDVGALV